VRKCPQFPGEIIYAWGEKNFGELMILEKRAFTSFKEGKGRTCHEKKISEPAKRERKQLL